MAVPLHVSSGSLHRLVTRLRSISPNIRMVDRFGHGRVYIVGGMYILLELSHYFNPVISQ